MSAMTIEGPERKVLGSFAFAALIVGVLFGTLLANSLDQKVLPPGYWDTLMTVTGVSALPLVATAVLVIRSHHNLNTQPVGRWGATLLVGGMIAFIVALTVIGVCVYQTVITPDAGKVPDKLALWVATLGAGLTLGAVAAGVAAAALDTIDDSPPSST
jgi:hypothetical protein